MILEFAFERKNMLCHIFSAESEAIALRPTERGRRRKSPACRGRGSKWRGPGEAGGVGCLGHRFEVVPSDTQTFRILREVLEQSIHRRSKEFTVELHKRRES